MDRIALLSPARSCLGVLDFLRSSLVPNVSQTSSSSPPPPSAAASHAGPATPSLSALHSSSRLLSTASSLTSPLLHTPSTRLLPLYHQHQQQTPSSAIIHHEASPVPAPAPASSSIPTSPLSRIPSSRAPTNIVPTPSIKPNTHTQDQSYPDFLRLRELIISKWSL